MENYKKIDIELGGSDIAMLICEGYTKEDEGVFLHELCFGFDGSYHAYVLEESQEIPEHYKLWKTFTSWLKIYDDWGLKFYAACPCKLYRAGSFGIILQVKDLSKIEKSSNA